MEHFTEPPPPHILILGSNCSARNISYLTGGPSSKFYYLSGISPHIFFFCFCCSSAPLKIPNGIALTWFHFRLAVKQVASCELLPIFYSAESCSGNVSVALLPPSRSQMEQPLLSLVSNWFHFRLAVKQVASCELLPIFYSAESCSGNGEVINSCDVIRDSVQIDDICDVMCHCPQGADNCLIFLISNFKHNLDLCEIGYLHGVQQIVLLTTSKIK